MSEMRSDRPEDVPPEGQGPRYGRRGYGDDEGAWAWWWWVLGIIVIGLIIWWIVAAATPRAARQVATGPSAERVGAAAPAGAVSIPAVLSSPNQYLGRAVSVRGVAGQMIGTNAFVLQSESTGGGATGPGILVYGQSQVMQSVQPGQPFQVTGTVQRFDAAAMQRVTGRQANLRQFRDWENQPAIEAGAVTMLNPASGQTGGGPRRAGTGY